MFEPISRGASQDVFGLQSVVARKCLDSYSVFDWGRMPDGIPHRGRFHALVESFINSKIGSTEEWTGFFRSADAHQFRKAATGTLKNGQVTASLNEIAESFPMRTSDLGLIRESDFREGKMIVKPLTASLIREDETHYLLSEQFAEVKVEPISILGKLVWDFSEWKKHQGPKAFPFDFECTFKNGEFPEVELKCSQKSISSDVTFTEALLMTEMAPAKLQELVLRVTWIAGFIQHQLKAISPIEDRKVIRIRMGMDDEFVFLGATVEFTRIEEQLQKYYSSTIWGKVVLDLQNQAKAKGSVDWKRQCFEPAPWLDPKMKSEFSAHYQKLISGIASCLSE